MTEYTVKNGKLMTVEKAKGIKQVPDAQRAKAIRKAKKEAETK